MKSINKIFLILLAVFLFNSLTSAQWVSSTSGTSNFLPTIDVVIPTKIYCGGFSGTFLLSTNTGQTWVVKTAPAASNINSVSFPPTGFATTGWTAVVSGVYKTTNEGVSWTQQLSGNHQDVFYKDANTGFALTSTSEIIRRSINGGTNYTDIVYTNISDLFGKDFTMASGTHAFIMGSDNDDSSFVFRSTNGGINWNPVFKTAAFLNDIAFIDINTGFLVGNFGVLLRTSNGGTSWLSISSGLTNNIHGISVLNATTVYVVGESGKVLKSTNSGVNWFLQTSNTTANLQGVDGSTNESIVVACGANGTIIRTVNGGVTSVMQTGNEIPESFSLSQNYPNPFNPNTNIKFNIAAAGNVTLKVYNIIGKEVAVLVSQDLNPGSYDVDFDASALPSGTYFYRISSGTFTETKKMILIK